MDPHEDLPQRRSLMNKSEGKAAGQDRHGDSYQTTQEEDGVSMGGSREEEQQYHLLPKGDGTDAGKLGERNLERRTIPKLEKETNIITESPQLGDEQFGTTKMSIGRKGLLEAQKQDKDCQHLIKTLSTGSEQESWHRDHTFRIAPDGVLEEVTCDLTGAVVYKVVLPQRMVQQAVEDAHAGHLKTKKTLDKLRSNYFFKRMYATCHRFVQGCPTCQEKDRGPKRQAPLGDMPEPLGAWHTVAVDVLGPLPQTRTGKKYIVVMTDYLTKYVLAVATRDQTAETTAAVLMEKFLEYGLPEKLITDNGSNFRSRLVNELCRLLKISRLFTTPYHPQFNGLCERQNRVLAAMLRAFVAENQTDWDKYLPYVMHAYRAAPQESTKESPFFLMFFHPCRAPLDIMLADNERRLPQLEEMEATKAEMVKKLQKAFQVVRQRLKKAREDQKRAHDKRSKPIQFHVGEEVYLLDERVPEGATRKLKRPWKPGYRVIKRIGPLNYLIEHPDRRGKELRVHAQRLKAAVPAMTWPEPDQPAATRPTADDRLVAVPPSNARQPPTLLDAWLEEERCRYKPFTSDPDWGDELEGELRLSEGAGAQERAEEAEAGEPIPENDPHGPPGEATTPRAGLGETCRHPLEGRNEWEGRLRRSKRLQEKRDAQEGEQPIPHTMN